MKKLIFLLLISVCFFQSKAQLLFDYAYHPLTSEVPLGFVKHNTFTILLSSSKQYPNGTNATEGIRIIGFNNDKSLRFNKLVSSINTSIPIKMRAFDRITTCIPTTDKGLLIAAQGIVCNSSFQTSYNACVYAKIDSLGSTVFSTLTINPNGPLGAFGNSNGGAGFTSNTFYYLTINSTDLNKINPINGVLTSTAFASFSGSISATAVNWKQQIVVSSTNSLITLDTTGTSILNLPVAINYSKIRTYSKKYYLLQSNNTSLDVRDSLLNLISSISTSTSNSISSFSIFNDSVYVTFHNTLTDQSALSVYSWPLDPISSQTINIAKSKLVAFEKDLNYNFMVAENSGNFNLVYSTGFVKQPIFNSGYATFKNLNTLSYPSDIVLKRIKQQSFQLNGFNYYSGNTYRFDYQNSIVVFNNSTDTIKSFHLNHPMYGHFIGSSQNCNLLPNTIAFDSTYHVIINPLDSIEVQIPLMAGYIDYAEQNKNTFMNFDICYNVSLPNNKIDNNPVNSNSCIQQSVFVGIEELNNDEHKIKVIPIPANDHLIIQSKESIQSYTVSDLTGKTLMTGSNSKQIDISSLSAGLYYITLYQNDGIITRKFIKQ